MRDQKITDGELAKVGLARSEFRQLNRDGREYILSRLSSYDKLDKLYQVMEAVRVLEKDSGKDAATLLSSDKDRELIIKILKDYRMEERAESVSEFCRKWMKERS